MGAHNSKIMIVPKYTIAFAGLLAATSPSAKAEFQFVIDVSGVEPEGIIWADSFSVGDECYCSISSLDYGIGPFLVEWKEGHWATVAEICSALTPPDIDMTELGGSIPTKGNSFGAVFFCPGNVTWFTHGHLLLVTTMERGGVQWMSMMTKDEVA